MSERKKLLSVGLAGMDSAEAAELLMTCYPLESVDYGEALLLISSRSWKRSDQKRLAKYFFRKLPFSSAKGYEVFASFMSVKNLLECVKSRLPMSADDVDLLLYYLIPVLNKAAKNDSDRQIVMDFISEIQPPWEKGTDSEGSPQIYSST